MAARDLPTVAQAKRDPHEQKLDEMHDALYSLGSQMRPPSGGLSGNGAALLPSDLAPANPKAAAAKKHVDRLHKAFKSLKKGKEK